MKPEEYLAVLEAGHELTLPSGLEVRVRPIDSNVLLNGDYSEALMTIVRMHVLGEKVKDAEGNDTAPASLLEQTNATRQWCEIVAENCIIEPKIVRTATHKKGEFPLKMLPTPDLYFLSGLIDKPLIELASFCEKQNQTMELLRIGKSELPDASGTDGDLDVHGERDEADGVSADQPVVDVLSV